MLSIRLSENLENRLNKLAKKTGRAKSYYAKQAIEQFLEDKEEYLLAVARLEKNGPRMSLEEMERELGLDD